MIIENQRKNDRSYGPSTIYIHEKKMPYPYYMSEPHRCEIMLNDSQGYMMKAHYVVPLTILGAIVVFAVLTVGLLILVDRARLTPVIRARIQNLQNQPNLISIEEILMKALDVYNQLNSS